MDFSLSTHVYLGVGTAEREDDCAAIFESLQAKYAAETNVVHNYLIMTFSIAVNYRDSNLSP